MISVEEFIACRFSKNISISSKFAINHLSVRYNLPNSKFKLMYNFVDNIFFDTFKKNFILNDSLKICFVGRLVKSKQPLLIFDIVKNFENIEVFILGKGPLLMT